MTRLVSVIAGPAYGGAHNQLVELAPLLARRGFETIAVLPDEATEACERVAAAGIEVVARPLHRPRAGFRPAANLALMRSLRAEVDQLSELFATLGADIVQVHGPTNPQAAWAARRRDDGPAVLWQMLDTRAPRALLRATVPMVRRYADAVSTFGAALIAMHPGLGRLGERIVVIYPPVDTERFRPDRGERAEARAALGIEPGDERPVAASLGVLTPQKGHENLLEAAASLPKRSISVRLIGAPSAGHESYRARLEGLAEQRFGAAESARIFVDPGSRVAQLLRGVDIFVMPSVRRSEGIPTAVLEAMASGLAVVVTRVGAITELVEDQACGLIVEPSDPSALATAIGSLLADPNRRAAFGARGRILAETRFGLERLADLHQRAYEIALEHRAKRRSLGQRKPP